MKRIPVLFVILLLLFALAGCKEAPLAIKNADNVSIFYGVSSYAMFGADENTLKALSDDLNDLSFEATDQQMDISTMLSIHFFKDEKQIAQISVDENNVCWLNGNTENLKIVSGTFSYKDVKAIYEKSKES